MSFTTPSDTLRDAWRSFELPHIEQITGTISYNRSENQLNPNDRDACRPSSSLRRERNLRKVTSSHKMLISNTLLLILERANKKMLYTQNTPRSYFLAPQNHHKELFQKNHKIEELRSWDLHNPMLFFKVMLNSTCSDNTTLDNDLI